MYTKYGIKSYPDNKSYISQRNNHNQIGSKNYTNSRNEENILETTFQPKCIFTKQNDNLSFYQSSSKNSFMNSKKDCNQNNENITPIMKGKNTIYHIQRTIQERNKENIIQNFSYNYSDINDNKTCNNTRTIKNNINNINININPNTNNFNPTNRISIEKNIIKNTKRKRITKSCKRQYNVQKRDNFNVLSYKPPEEDDSDINYSCANKKKIIHLYKKQDVDEIFFPSKRTHSPNIPTKRKKLEQKYQTRTLKYKNENNNFFGSFIIKKEQMKKSLSKKRIKEINDFNIDKLIEIGDKIMNSNILCLKKIRIKKNKYQIPINTNNNCFNFSKYSKRTFNNNNTKINLDENKENIPIQNRVIKKLIKKNKLKNSQLSTNQEKNETEQLTNNDNTVRKYLNFKNEKNNYNNNNIIDNNTTNSSVVIRRRNKNTNNAFLRKQNSFDKNMNMNMSDLGEEIPKRKYQKINCDLSLKTNNGNINTNYIIINKDNNENKKEKIINENNIGRNSRQTIEKNNREILIDINANKKFNKYRNIQMNQNKTKNYYGYDDRHHLEDTINNHSYYESLHSNKRGVNYNIYNKGV